MSAAPARQTPLLRGALGLCLLALVGHAEAAWRGPLYPGLPALGASADVLLDGGATERAARLDVEVPGSPRFFRQGGRLLGHLARSPARLEGRDWQRFGAGLLILAGTIAVLDEPLRDAVDPTPGGNSLLHRADRFGERSTTHALAAGLYGWGAWQEDARAQAAGIDVFVATLISGGLVTSKLKRVFGRERPYLAGNAQAFDLMGGRSQDQRAFPSGHSTEAFTVASVIAAHYPDRPAVVWTAYGLAALTGLSRMKKDQHWASDVLAGSAIGYGIGHAVVRFNTAQREQVVSLGWQYGAPHFESRLCDRRQWRREVP